MRWLAEFIGGPIDGQVMILRNDQDTNEEPPEKIRVPMRTNYTAPEYVYELTEYDDDAGTVNRPVTDEGGLESIRCDGTARYEYQGCKSNDA